jgi:prepilin-type N-terminal cleavage/methylation domain-containing protein
LGAASILYRCAAGGTFPEEFLMKKEAFTLVEMLVVIAVVALLVALLMPVLSRARSAALTVGCLSNLQELGMGDQLYSNTYDGVEFTAWQVVNKPNGNQVSTAWTALLNPFVSTESNSSDSADAVNSVYTCPAAYNPHYAIYSTGNQFLLTYGVNCNVHTWGNPNFPSSPARTLVYRNQIQRPAEIINFADAAQSSGVWTCAGWLSGTDSAWYGGWYDNYAQANQQLPIVGNADIAGGLYGIRYRHDGQQSTCVDYLHGHAGVAKMGTLLYRNICVADN